MTTPHQPQQPVPPAPVPPVPQPGHAQPGAYRENPGQTLGIVGIVLNALGINIGGIILGVMSRNKSKEVGMSTTLGTVAMVWGIIGTVLGFLYVAFIIVMFIVVAATSDGSSSSSYNSSNDYSSSSSSELFN